MFDLVITAVSRVTEADTCAVGSRLGPRFGRLDRASQLSLLAVDALGLPWESLPRDRIGICLAARRGSLSTDWEFWRGRAQAGGPSPTLFAYTLPSAALGEVAIRYGLTGPNLCFVGTDGVVLAEAADLIRRGEAAGVACISCDVLSAEAAEALQASATARACALFLQPRGLGNRGALAALGKNDRDMESLCASLSPPK
jgi:3-oxoacyl-(acyl-carrier-protein) synthase